MKKVAIICLIVGLMATGCQSKGLLSYQEAVETTGSIETGEVLIEVDVRSEFNKMGLSIEEEKDLSVYENIKTKIRSKYDDRKNLMETNIYYIFGAMGIDASIFLLENELYLQIPIINMYMKISEDELDQMESQAREEEAAEIQALDFTVLMESWLSVFREDNVVVGQNTYVMTDEGQIKTTTYSFHLDEGQLERLQDELMSYLDKEAFNEMVKDYIGDFGSNDEEVFDFNVEELLDSIKLTHLEGQAHVDYDNRLIKQSFILYGEGNDPVPGNIETFEIELTMTYTNLGDEITFNIPEFTEDNLLDQEELNQIFNQFNNN